MKKIYRWLLLSLTLCTTGGSATIILPSEDLQLHTSYSFSVRTQRGSIPLNQTQFELLSLAQKSYRDLPAAALSALLESQGSHADGPYLSLDDLQFNKIYSLSMKGKNQVLALTASEFALLSILLGEPQALSAVALTERLAQTETPVPDLFATVAELNSKSHRVFQRQIVMFSDDGLTGDLRFHRFKTPKSCRTILL